MESNKPKTFGNKYSSCLISGIATFTCVDSSVNIQIKSGEVIKLEFKVNELAEKAFEKLKESFDNQVLECNPCNCCSNKDKALPTDRGHSEGATNCDICYAEFNQFELKE